LEELKDEDFENHFDFLEEQEEEDAEWMQSLTDE